MYRKFATMRYLARGASTEETPELFCLELRVRVLLPHVVESGEEDDLAWVGGESTLDRADSGLLVGLRRDGGLVGKALCWPASLGDDDLLVGVGKLLLEGWDLSCKEASRIRCGSIAIKEGVAVDSTII